MFLAALLLKPRHGNNIIHQQRNVWYKEDGIKKMWYTYTIEYYSDIKKKKIMPFTATWM